MAPCCCSALADKKGICPVLFTCLLDSIRFTKNMSHDVHLCAHESKTQDVHSQGKTLHKSKTISSPSVQMQILGLEYWVCTLDPKNRARRRSVHRPSVQNNLHTSQKSE
jgi:hypothetical protein